MKAFSARSLRVPSFFLAVLFLFAYFSYPLSFSADPEPDGWKIEGDTLVLTLDTPDYTNKDPAPWHAHADGIKSVRIESGVHKIGAYALADLANVREIVFPQTVSEIGQNALVGCAGLESLTFSRLPVSENAVERTFYPIGALFGTAPFADSVQAEEFHSIVKVSEKVFRPSEKSTVYYLPRSLENVTFSGTELPPYAFSGCKNLKSVRFTGALTEVPDGAFINCSSLSKIVFDHSPASVGHEAFKGCPYLLITCPSDFDNVILAADYTDDPSRIAFVKDPECRHPTCGWVIVSSPTCLDNGERQYVCYDCDARLDRVVTPAMGHDYVTEAEPATCQRTGLRRTVCMRCGDVLSSEILPVVGHDYVFLKTEGGKDLYECIFCAEILRKDASGGQNDPKPPADDPVDPVDTDDFLPGDVNEDGRIGARDLFLLRRFLAGLETPSERKIRIADLVQSPKGILDENDADSLADRILASLKKEGGR